MRPASALTQGLLHRLEGDDREPGERARLARLMALFAELPPPPDPDRDFPRYTELKGRFMDAAQGSDGEALEERFLELYAHLHMHEAPYTAEERARMDQSGGYWNHAGGLSPLLRAEPWLDPDCRSADFGCGNGLQGLLLQALYPHASTQQIDISSRALAIGRRLQHWLGIPEHRVEWTHADVLEVSAAGLDFIYLYRPVRPEGLGRRFYQRFAADLKKEPRIVTIFSIADCLREFLPSDFEMLHSDGHLTCYRRVHLGGHTEGASP